MINLYKKFTDKHVYNNVNELIELLLTTDNDVDWINDRTWEFEGETFKSEDDLIDYLEESIDFVTRIEPDEEQADEYHDAIDNSDNFVDYVEPLEYYSVSDTLFNKLKDEGEMVADGYGLKLWARTTSGMNVYMDRVIRKIVKEGV